MTDVADLAFRVDSRGLIKGGKALDDLADKANRAEGATDRLIARAEKAGTAMQNIGSRMTMGVTLPLAAFAGAATNSFAKFDSAMTQSLAIMGDVSDEMQNEMATSAREMAKETVFSAEQAAESYFFLASAGLDAKQSVEALPQVAKFAQAGMFDMATATDLATDAQSALGLSSDNAAVNLQNLTRITDVLVGANTIANASVEQFASSLTNRAGSAMKQLNIEMEEGVAVLAAWADQGIKGLRAGEQFNIVTREMERAARKNADEWERLNISVFDSQGNFRGMADIIAGLEGALEGMSTEQQGATLEMLGFQSESIAAIRPLIGLSDQIREYTSELKDMGGVTDEISNNQLQSFGAQLDLTRSRINDIFITIGEALVPVLQTLNDDVNGLLPMIDKWAKAFRDADAATKITVISIGAAVGAIGPLLVVMGTLVRSVATLIPLMQRLNAATLANPFFLVATAVGAAAVALERQYTPAMKEVGATEQIINVITRAWIILAETVKAGAELTMAMAQTMVGAVRAVVAPIEGMVRASATAMDRLINRDFAGARDAVMGIGQEIANASQRGREQMMEGMEGMTDWWSDLPDRADKVIAKVTETRDALLETGDAGKDSAKGLGILSGALDLAMGAFESLGGQAAETNEELEGTRTGTDKLSESAQEFEQTLRDQIDSMRRQKLELQGGTRAVLMYELAQLKAEGATAEQVATLEDLIDRVVESQFELEHLERQAGDTGEMFEAAGIPVQAFEDHLFDVGDAADDAAERFTDLESTALRGLDRMTTAFSAFITGEIDSFTDFADTLNQIMQQTMTDMVDSMIKARMSGEQTGGMTQMEGFGALGVLGNIAGNAIGGGVGAGIAGAASGASLGATVGSVVPVIGTAVGAIVGAIIGGAAGYFGGEDPPAFRLGGEQTYQGSQRFQSPRTEQFESDLGTFYGNFRRFDPSQERKIVDAVMEFDEQIADLLNADQRERASAALEGFDWDQDEGADIEGLIRARFDTVLGTFDGFIQGMVERENGIQDQMKSLAELLKMKELAEAGDTLGGIGFEDLVLTMEQLQRTGETLGDTYGRVVQQFDDYAAIARDLAVEDMTSGLNEFQQDMVNIQLEGLNMAESLREAASAAGLEAARSEDLARVHELTANRMAAVIGRMEEAGRGLVEQLFGTELTRLQDEISAAREGGASDEDIAGLLERQEELRREAEERERQQQARELAQIVADMSQASGDSFEEVAQRLGAELDQIADVLGMEEGAFTQMLEDMQVDPQEMATEIKGMKDAIVDQLILLPGAFADALSNARDREEDTDPVGPQPGPSPGPGPGNPGPPGIGPGFRPHDITDPITESAGETTAAVRDLDGNIAGLIGSQQDISANVAAALNNLASALRRQERDRAGQPRSSRTRTEVS